MWGSSKPNTILEMQDFNYQKKIGLQQCVHYCGERMFAFFPPSLCTVNDTYQQTSTQRRRTGRSHPQTGA